MREGRGKEEERKGEKMKKLKKSAKSREKVRIFRKKIVRPVLDRLQGCMSLISHTHAYVHRSHPPTKTRVSALASDTGN
jgi:hypothetical protein